MGDLPTLVFVGVVVVQQQLEEEVGWQLRRSSAVYGRTGRSLVRTWVLMSHPSRTKRIHIVVVFSFRMDVESAESVR